MAGDFQLTASLSMTTSATAASSAAANLLSHDHPAPGRGCSLPAEAAPSAIPTLDLHRIPTP